MDGDMMMERVAPVTYIPPPPPETEGEVFQQGMLEGINFDKYDNIPVEITGTDPTKPVNTFGEAKLHKVNKLS